MLGIDCDNMVKRMDRMCVTVGTAADLKKSEKQQLLNTSIEEKLETITYLRESFYGAEATTGRLQRVYTVFKRA